MPAIDVSALSLAELRYAVALAEHGHFGRAASACHVTQPTLSGQIKKLETTLRARLFERTSKRVHTTPLGAEIVEAARAVLDGVDAIADLADRRREPLSGPLRLAMIPTLGPYYLPRIAPLLAREFPRLAVVFRELKTSDLLAEIARRELDAGILALPVATRGLEVEPLFDEPFWVLAPAGHRLARLKAVREEQLGGERVLLLDEGHCLRDQALEICQDARPAAPGGADFRATSIETLRHMVAAGMGVTLLPALALGEPAVAAAAARPFADPQPGRRMALVWRRSHPRGADHRRLAAFLRTHLPPGVSAPGS